MSVLISKKGCCVRSQWHLLTEGEGLFLESVVQLGKPLKKCYHVKIVFLLFSWPMRPLNYCTFNKYVAIVTFFNASLNHYPLYPLALLYTLERSHSYTICTKWSAWLKWRCVNFFVEQRPRGHLKWFNWTRKWCWSARITLPTPWAQNDNWQWSNGTQEIRI